MKRNSCLFINYGAIFHRRPFAFSRAESISEELSSAEVEAPLSLSLSVHSHLFPFVR